MITPEGMMSIDKGDLEEASKNPGKEDIPQLVKWLDEKDHKVRYQAFLLLKNRSSFLDDVYPYWDVFRSKVKSAHSYQRSIGLMLLAENAKWDDAGRMEDTVDDFLALLNDEKPITARQCIQSLEQIARAKPGLNEKTARRLLSFDLSAVRETMRKVILLDLLNALPAIRKTPVSDEITGFILDALSGEVLDKKSKKQIEAPL